MYYNTNLLKYNHLDTLNKVVLADPLDIITTHHIYKLNFF